MVVDHIFGLTEAVVFAGVDEHDHVVFTSPTGGVVHLHALSPVDGSVFITEGNEQGGVEGVESVDGGVTNVSVHIAPEGLVHAAL